MIIDDSATIVERVMYSPYGVPFGIPVGDLVTSSSFAQPADGKVDGADLGVLIGSYWGSSHNIADLDNDGDVDGDDLNILNANWGNNLGWGLMSNHHNRLGYAGYVFDENLADTKWHVRHRVLESVLGRSLQPWKLSTFVAVQTRYLSESPLQPAMSAAMAVPTVSLRAVRRGLYTGNCYGDCEWDFVLSGVTPTFLEQNDPILIQRLEVDLRCRPRQCCSGTLPADSGKATYGEIVPWWTYNATTNELYSVFDHGAWQGDPQLEYGFRQPGRLKVFRTVDVQNRVSNWHAGYTVLNGVCNSSGVSTDTFRGGRIGRWFDSTPALAQTRRNVEITWTCPNCASLAVTCTP